MRTAMLTMIGALSLLASASLAQAGPSTVPAVLHVYTGPTMVQPVADGCGRGYHRVPGHRRYDGSWSHGRCVPNRWW